MRPLHSDLDRRARAVIAALDDALALPVSVLGPFVFPEPTISEVAEEIIRYRRALAVVQARIAVITQEPSRFKRWLRLATMPGRGTAIEPLNAKATSLASTLADLERLRDELAELVS